MGLIRSSSSPSNSRMNVAATLCGPAVTATGSVDTVRPSGSDSDDPAVDLHERGARAVDRDFHLDLADRAAEQRARGLAVQQQLELVVTVGEEVVRDDDSAARAKGRAFDAFLLRLRARHFVRRRARVSRGVADDRARDVGRRAQVALHHRRRRHLDVRDVVEARADRVRRQIFRHVDVDAEHRLDRGRVFRAVEPLEGPATGIRRGGRGVERGLERRHEPHAGSAIRLRLALGRHQTRAQLANHLLGGRRVIGGVRDVELVERHLALQVVVVVTAAAVFANGVVGGETRRGGGRGRFEKHVRKWCGHAGRARAHRQDCEEHRRHTHNHWSLHGAPRRYEKNLHLRLPCVEWSQGLTPGGAKWP